MSERVDDILGLIEKGLQESGEDHVYSDVAPNVGVGCVRCGRERAKVAGIESEFCAQCREYLLGDGDEFDPAERRVDPCGHIDCMIALAVDERVNRRLEEIVETARVVDLRAVASNDAVDAAIHAFSALVAAGPDGRTRENIEALETAIQPLVDGVRSQMGLG